MNNMKNEYFRLVKIFNNDKNHYEVLTCVRKYDDRDIWEAIYNQFLNTQEYIDESVKDPYGSIYHLDLKHMLKVIAPDILNLFKEFLIDNDKELDQDDIAIYLGTKHDYAKFDEKFANELNFLEYVNSEYSEMDKHCNITEKILEEAGFEYLENESELMRKAHELDPYLSSKDYKAYRIWTTDKKPLKLDIDNNYTNRGTIWHLHIDNDICQTIGCADIDTVWEFNTLMQVFGSKFRL